MEAEGLSKDFGVTHFDGGSTAGLSSRPWQGMAARIREAKKQAGPRNEGKNRAKTPQPPFCNKIIC